MYQETRGKFSLSLLLRWLGAIVVASQCVGLIEKWLGELTRLLFITSWNMSHTSSAISFKVVYYMMESIDLFHYLFGMLLLFVVLRSWRRSEELGQRMWYHRAKLWQFAGLVAVLYCLTITIGHWSPSERFVMRFLRDFNMIADNSGLGIYQKISRNAFIALMLGHYSILIWWFDRPPRLRNLTAGLLVLLLYMSTSIDMRDAVNFIMGWRSAAPFSYVPYSRFWQFLDLMHYFSNQLRLALVGYLIVIVYHDIRRRVISAFKPARAHND
jgi:hypothetical protein